jgi:hypothetical protein
MGWRRAKLGASLILQPWLWKLQLRSRGLLLVVEAYVDKLFDITLSESRDGALLGITVRSERAKEWLSKRATHPLRRAGDTLWVDSTAAAPMLNEAAKGRLAIGWSSDPN